MSSVWHRSLPVLRWRCRGSPSTCCATDSREQVSRWFRGTVQGEGFRVFITREATPSWCVARTGLQRRSGTPLRMRRLIACSAAQEGRFRTEGTIAPCIQRLPAVILRKCGPSVATPVSSSWPNWRRGTPQNSLPAMFCSCSIATAERNCAPDPLLRRIFHTLRFQP